MKQKFTTDDLVALATLAANRYADGHLTIQKFTTGWKCKVETPDFWNKDFEPETYESLNDAIVAELKRLNTN